MLTAIRAPSLDASSAKATLLRILINPGEAAAKGAAIAEIETEKAAFAVECPHDGTVREWLVECGCEVDVGAALATLETDDASAVAFDPAKPQAEGVQRARAQAGEGGANLYNCSEPSRVLFNDGLKIPAPKISSLPHGAPSEPAAENFAARDVPISEVRKLAGSGLRTQERMLWSARNIPTSSVTVPIEFGELKAKVEAYRAATRAQINPTDVIVWAAAQTLRSYPELNAYRNGTELRLYKDVHVGIVYDIRGELAVPAITNADALSIPAIAAELRGFYRALTARKLPPAKLGVATFTISNLSGTSATHATPLINAGQSAVLAICAPFVLPAAGDDALRFVPHVNLVLGFDHSIVNGARAAAFLQAVAKLCAAVKLEI
jgi:pyruvate dehydrogenase E2 component (dihydrolipoamide acetyltransferase)